MCRDVDDLDRAANRVSIGLGLKCRPIIVGVDAIDVDDARMIGKLLFNALGFPGECLLLDTIRPCIERRRWRERHRNTKRARTGHNGRARDGRSVGTAIVWLI